MIEEIIGIGLELPYLLRKLVISGTLAENQCGKSLSAIQLCIFLAVHRKYREVEAIAESACREQLSDRTG